MSCEQRQQDQAAEFALHNAEQRVKVLRWARSSLGFPELYDFHFAVASWPPLLAVGMLAWSRITPASPPLTDC
jgi:hypothetical protein